jgi:hypothetical protein
MKAPLRAPVRDLWCGPVWMDGAWRGEARWGNAVIDRCTHTHRSERSARSCREAPSAARLWAEGNLDAHEIVQGLWVGSIPPIGEHLARLGFRTLVLCTRTYQPPAGAFQGISVIRARLDDDPRGLTAPQQDSAISAAELAAESLNAGRPVLVTCRAGRNRSGLVAAIALHLATGASTAETAALVAQQRPDALTNPAFASWVAGLAPAS